MDLLQGVLQQQHHNQLAAAAAEQQRALIAANSARAVMSAKRAVDLSREERERERKSSLPPHNQLHEVNMSRAEFEKKLTLILTQELLEDEKNEEEVENGRRVGERSAFRRVRPEGMSSLSPSEGSPLSTDSQPPSPMDPATMAAIQAIGAGTKRSIQPMDEENLEDFLEVVIFALQ